MGFEESVCDGTTFGPIVDGSLSLCFIDGVLYALHAIFFLVYAVIRVVQCRREAEKPGPSDVKFRVKFVLHVLSILTPLLQIIVRLLLQSALVYEVGADAFVCFAWTLSLLVIVMEESRSMHHSIVLKCWWIASFMIGATKLQTYVSEQADSVDGALQWYYFTFGFQFLVWGLVCIVGLFFTQEEDRFKAYAKLKGDGASGRDSLVASSPDAKATSYGALDVEDEDDVDALGKMVDDTFATSPEDTASLLSRLTFWWCNSLLSMGWHRALEFTDLWPLRFTDRADTISRSFEQLWLEEQANETPSLARTIRRCFGRTFVVAGVGKLLNDVLVFSGPLILEAIIAFIKDENAPMWHGVLLALGMFASGVATTVVVQNYFFLVFRVGQQARSAIVTVVYRKAFLISTVARQEFSTGEVVNHMSIDAKRLMDLAPYLHMIWSAPLQIIVSISLLYRLVGAAVFAGVGYMIVMIPVNVALIKKLMGYQKAMMVHKDKRVKIMNEVLQGIRIIKFFAWEESYKERVNEIRDDELRTLKSSAYLRAGTTFSWATTPVLVSLITFATYAGTNGQLTAEVAFPALALFNILRFPLNMFPNVISGLVEANISVKRIQRFLLSEERDPHAVEWHPDQAVTTVEHVVSIDKGTFAWDPERPVLRDLTVRIPTGQFVAIVGTVGSGKSSLLRALLGDLVKLDGRVVMTGSLAYACQQAWIQNATVRENILFGQPFNAGKYDLVTRACELRSDLDMLPGGDQTEIGEKGINLSGGQKQRVSLARAVYQDADTYLLDDPLSAVDVHVGRNIFEHCMCGVLAGKTRILVTHQLQYLSGVDYILVMKEGTIVEEGSYDNLMDSGGEFSRVIREFTTEGNKDEEGEDGAKGVTAAEEGDVKAVSKKGNKIVSVEERDVGSLSARVYVDYFMALGSIIVAFVVFGMFLVEIITRVGGDWWLSIWSNDSDLVDHTLKYYLSIYAVWGCSNALVVLSRALVVAFAGINAARTLHAMVLSKVIRAPSAFFDTTPTGRILNRFSKDIYSVDETIPRILSMFMLMAFWSFGVIVVISTVTPLFLVFLFPLGVLYQHVQQYYIRSSRELKRLDSISRSPIYNHFTETLNGISTIRSYGSSQRFITENEDRLDRNQRAYFSFVTANRWLGVRLEFVGTCIVFLAALFAVTQRESIDPGLAGLSITYALQVTGVLNWLVRMSTEAENEMVAVERINQYVDVEEEAPAEIPDNKPPAGWPHAGCVTFNDFKMRYRPGLPLVLRGINVHIQECEKVGIVGRTGAGKSSLVLALFRLVEAAEGSIVIDDFDISRIGLNDLRRALSIIPQDPILFTGTIRSNLDPFNLHAEGDIWTALDRVHLREVVEREDDGLDSAVTEGGGNYSVGQRQLLCLARALLRKGKILVMDEATSSVDAENDSLIQQTIRDCFADRTVFTIAHRIGTIMDSDKVMVMDRGVVVEFDTPQNLIADPNSIFAGMVKEAGV